MNLGLFFVIDGIGQFQELLTPCDSLSDVGWFDTNNGETAYAKMDVDTDSGIYGFAG